MTPAQLEADKAALVARATEAHRTAPLAKCFCLGLVSVDGETRMALYFEPEGGDTPPRDGIDNRPRVVLMSVLLAQALSVDLDTALSSNHAVRALVHEYLAPHRAERAASRAAHDSAPCICTPPCPWDDERRAPRCKVTP